MPLAISEYLPTPLCWQSTPLYQSSIIEDLHGRIHRLYTSATHFSNKPNAVPLITFTASVITYALYGWQITCAALLVYKIASVYRQRSLPSGSQTRPPEPIPEGALRDRFMHIARMGHGLPFETIRSIAIDRRFPNDTAAESFTLGLFFLAFAGVEMAVITSLEGEMQNWAAQNAMRIGSFPRRGVTIQSIRSLDRGTWDSIHGTIAFNKWMELGLSFQTFAGLEQSLRRWVIENGVNIPYLVKAGFPLSELRNPENAWIVRDGKGIVSLIHAGISFETIKNMGQEESRWVIPNGYEISCLIREGLSFQAIRDLDSATMEWVIPKAVKISSLMRAGVTFQAIRDLNQTERDRLLRSGSLISALINGGVHFESIRGLNTMERNLAGIDMQEMAQAGITFETYRNLNAETKFWVLEGISRIRRLSEAGISFATLRVLEENTREWVLRHSLEVSSLVSAGVPFNELLRLNADLRERVQQNFYGITLLLRNGVSFESLTSRLEM